MINREIIKAEIDKVEDKYLELLYKIIKAMVTPAELWERYLVNQPAPQAQSGAAFLLSMAGMFDSGPNNTSENAHTVVTDFILQKHQESADDHPD